MIVCCHYLQFGDQGTETRGVEATFSSRVTPQPSDLATPKPCHQGMDNKKETDKSQMTAVYYLPVLVTCCCCCVTDCLPEAAWGRKGSSWPTVRLYSYYGGEGMNAGAHCVHSQEPLFLGLSADTQLHFLFWGGLRPQPMEWCCPWGEKLSQSQAWLLSASRLCQLDRQSEQPPHYPSSLASGWECFMTRVDSSSPGLAPVGG